MSTIYIHADESCLGNTRARPTPGGAAGLVELWKSDRWERRDYWESEPATTNNRMAIRSAIVPLRALTKACRVIFVSDSEYLVKGMTQWVHAWMRLGWKRKTGPIENVDLWRDLVDAAMRHTIDWRWVRGHAGHPRNEYANDLAVRAAKTQTSSGGLAPSGFEAWLEQQREKGKYLDFLEFEGPEQASSREAKG
jgi:ribonuclease HI